MAKIEQMLRLKYIEDFLRRRKQQGATFQEIEDFLILKFEEKDLAHRLNFTKRTFQRDVKTINEVSGIDITYHHHQKVYLISQEELDIYEENIFDNLLLIEAYRDVKHRKDIMFFEPRKAKGLQHLHGIIHAIINRKVIAFTYQKFWDTISQSRVVEPYALKECKNRWYLLGKDFQSEELIIKTFGLDRITDLEIKNKVFEKQTYDIEKDYQHSFGIIAPNGKKPEKIILSFDWQQGNYIKTLPLHPSQKVISENEKKIVFELFMVPTYDFKQEILSHGNRVKVIEPSSFAKEIITELKESLQHYL